MQPVPQADLAQPSLPSDGPLMRVAALAARLLNVPAALILRANDDAAELAACIGVPPAALPAAQAFAEAALLSDRLLIVPDLHQALADLHTGQFPPPGAGLFFAAAVPMITRHGYATGALALFDYAARDLTAQELETLSDMACLAGLRLAASAQGAASNSHARTYATLAGLIARLDRLACDRPGTPKLGAMIDLAPAGAFEAFAATTSPVAVAALIESCYDRLTEAVGSAATLHHMAALRFAFTAPADQPATRQAVTRLASLPPCAAPHAIPLAPAIGVAHFNAGAIASAQLMPRLLSEAWHARHSGRLLTEVDLTAEPAHARATALVTGAAAALREAGQLTFAYQPRIDLRTGESRCAEALLRWNHPTLGPVPPNEFIPLFERIAVTRSLTQWGIEAATAKAAELRGAGLDIAISVNVSGLNLAENDFARRLAAALARHNLPPSSIDLEFAETILLQQTAATTALFAELQEIGVAIAIDDFGTGYSNFAYLRHIPASLVKLDRSFISTLPAHAGNRTIVRSMIAMAHDLGYVVAAEGIETSECLNLLAEWGCDEGQGYFIARPLNDARLEEWLRRRRAPRQAAHAKHR